MSSARLVAVALCAVASASHAQDARLTDDQAKQRFNAHACNACHAVDEARIGPPYRAVALRYAGSSQGRVSWLATKIIVGGAGSWGAVPMVGNPRVSADEALEIARWILELAPRSPE